MTVTVAMYEKSHQHIRERLDALGLDVQVWTFDKDGMFTHEGERVPAQDFEVDYFWLSSHITRDGFRERAFEIVLSCRSINVLQTFNAGLDDPVYRKLADRGTRIVNSSAQGIAIAEYVLAQVLNVMHPVALQREQQAQRKWAITKFRELSRTRWLIVGFGPIGRALAKRVHAFEAGITVVRRSPQTSELVDTAGTLADLPELLPDADVVVLACSLTDETRGFANGAFFEKIKPGATLVNVARGALIDDDALTKALDDGRVSRAVLDVFNEEPLPPAHPLWAHPGVILTPHTSFAGDGVQGRWDNLFLEALPRFVNGEPLSGEVPPGDIP